jgi:hypothetical protein
MLHMHEKVFMMINGFPIIYEVVNDAAKKLIKEKITKINSKSGFKVTNSVIYRY